MPPESGIDIQFAEVTAIDLDNKSVTVQSKVDGSVIPNVPLSSPLHRQYVPVVGQQVVILRTHDSFTIILAELNEKAFNAPIQPGEVLMQGSGRGRIYLNQTGDVFLSDSTLSNVLKLISTVGFQITGDALAINIKGIGQINILEDKVELTKISGATGAVVSKIEMTDDNIEVTKSSGIPGAPSSKITVTDQKIDIDGVGVNLGPNPIAGVVTSISNVPGSHSYCLVTGAPIPCSLKVKADPGV